MREYELFLVIDADAADEGVTTVVDKVTQLITSGYGGVNGEVTKVDARGRRRLAYAINRKVECLDVVLTFHTPQSALPEIDRALKLDEQVLRYLIIRLDED
jgi:small subunit ribosomal protein S6